MSDNAEYTSAIDEFSKQYELLERMIQRGKNMPQPLVSRVWMLGQSAEKVSKEMSQLEALVHTSALVNTSLDLDKTLESVIDVVVEISGAERIYVMLSDRDGNLVIRAARNWDQESLPEGEVIFSRNIVEAAIDQREPILTLNAQEDDRFAQAASVAIHDLRSILCVPLHLRDQVIGVLYADNRMTAGTFERSLVPLMGAFANQVAIAIENARHFGRVNADLQKAQSELRRLQIQLDEDKVAAEVTAITDSDYFQQLARAADDLRARKAKRD